jgi:3-hydroxy-5-methyl-1-naphthoate 3-O-methyltransferase
MYLVATKPSYMGGFFRHISKQLIPNWLNLEEIVRTGKPTGRVNDQAGGEDFFAEFVNDLFPLSYPAASALGEYLNLRETTSEVRVLDLAAGSGVWGIALAQQSEHVKVSDSGLAACSRSNAANDRSVWTNQSVWIPGGRPS